MSDLLPPVERDLYRLLSSIQDAARTNDLSVYLDVRVRVGPVTVRKLDYEASLVFSDGDTIDLIAHDLEDLYSKLFHRFRIAAGEWDWGWTGQPPQR